MIIGASCAKSIYRREREHTGMWFSKCQRDVVHEVSGYDRTAALLGEGPDRGIGGTLAEPPNMNAPLLRLTPRVFARPEGATIHAEAFPDS